VSIFSWAAIAIAVAVAIGLPPFKRKKNIKNEDEKPSSFS
jgi:hypothetical protein